MTVSHATATFALRTGMLMLLVLGIVVRPALGLAGELHAMEHAAGLAGGGHGHVHDAPRHDHAVAHVDVEAVAAHAHGHGGHDGHLHAHDATPVTSAHDHDAHQAPGDAADGLAGSDDAAGHADHADRDHGGPDHARGSHGLLHQADVGCSAGLLIAYVLPEAFGFAVMLPSSAWVSAPPQRSTSPFRPPIA